MLEGGDAVDDIGINAVKAFNAFNAVQAINRLTRYEEVSPRG